MFALQRNIVRFSAEELSTAPALPAARGHQN